jgi:hypothetical protein
VSEQLLDILDAALSSLADPNPIQFRARDEEGVAAVRACCREGASTQRPLRGPIPRNAFLCGCLDWTDGKKVENLFVGFGQRSGRSTRVEAVGHSVGSIDQVEIPKTQWVAVQNWLASASRHEVLIAHNHPVNPFNILFDNLPIASATDRSAWLRSVVTGARIRFYLIENGFDREFRTPSILRVLRSLYLNQP